VVGSCEHDDEHSGSCATKLVSMPTIRPTWMVSALRQLASHSFIPGSDYTLRTLQIHQIPMTFNKLSKRTEINESQTKCPTTAVIYKKRCNEETMSIR
jgi:hypothetical protein